MFALLVFYSFGLINKTLISTISTWYMQCFTQVPCLRNKALKSRQMYQISTSCELHASDSPLEILRFLLGVSSNKSAAIYNILDKRGLFFYNPKPFFLQYWPKQNLDLVLPINVMELEHKTCKILAAERLRWMRFDNRLIIDTLKVVCCSKVKKGKKHFVT